MAEENNLPKYRISVLSGTMAGYWRYLPIGTPTLSCPTCGACVAWDDKDHHMAWHFENPDARGYR